MKTIINKLTFLVSTFFLIFIACNQDSKFPFFKDTSSPGVLTNVKYVPISGGVEITYDLPADYDVYYVEAIYLNNKEKKTIARSSKYFNKIIIEGLTNKEKHCDLYVVDREENRSAPFTFTFTPLELPIQKAAKSMTIETAFGGVRFKWKNLEGKPIIVDMYGFDTKKNENVKIQSEYSSDKDNNIVIRGLDLISTTFFAIVRDKYDNVSDTIFPNTPDKKLKPLFETKIDKTKISLLRLAGDSEWTDISSIPGYKNAIDGSPYTYLYSKGKGTPLTYKLSLNLNQKVMFSRIVVHMKILENYYYFGYNEDDPKLFDFYALKELPSSPEEISDLKNWVKLRSCEIIKPSGLKPGALTKDDAKVAKEGSSFDIDDRSEYKYFRFVIRETFGIFPYAAGFGEITFYGQIIK